MTEERPRDEQGSRTLLDQLAESSADIIWMFTHDWGELLFVNSAYEDVWGRPVDDLEADSADFLRGIHPDDRPRVRDAMARLTAGEFVELEYRVNVDEGFGRWVWVQGRPVYDDAGEVVSVAGFARDVTERKRHEEELRRQNERLDEFAQVVSHDLRNPLSVAGGRLALAAEECDSEHLDAVEAALHRMDDIVEATLTLARHGRTVTDPTSVAVPGLLEDCWEMVDTGGAELVVDGEFDLEGDPVQLRHLFENLFRNALDHAGSEPTVRVGPLAAGSGFYVGDDGPGIPVAERDAVFDPGYSNGPEGTGLGLTIVRRIAGAHGWTVRVTDADEGGARLEFDTVPPAGAVGDGDGRRAHDDRDDEDPLTRAGSR